MNIGQRLLRPGIMLAPAAMLLLAVSTGPAHGTMNGRVTAYGQRSRQDCLAHSARSPIDVRARINDNGDGFVERSKPRVGVARGGRRLHFDCPTPPKTTVHRVLRLVDRYGLLDFTRISFNGSMSFGKSTCPAGKPLLLSRYAMTSVTSCRS